MRSVKGVQELEGKKRTRTISQSSPPFFSTGNHGEADTTYRLGKHDEDKFRMAMERPVRVGKSRSMHFTLKGGKKVSPAISPLSPIQKHASS